MKFFFTIIALCAFLQGKSQQVADLHPTPDSAQTLYADIDELLGSFVGETYSVTMSADGTRIVALHGHWKSPDRSSVKMKLSESTYERGYWTPFNEIKIINNWQDENSAFAYSLVGSPALSFDGNQLYFSYNNGVFYSERKSNSWSVPRTAGDKINATDFQTPPLYQTSPSLSPDGQTLYFQRLDPKGRRRKPCFSIYKSSKDENDEWSAPVKLPWPVNQNCETSPYILVDGRTLYFSSYKPGSKERSLYMSKVDSEGEWTYPESLASIGSQSAAYICSVPASGDKIYYYDSESNSIQVADLPLKFRPDPVRIVRGTINSKQSGSPIDATLTAKSFDKDITTIKSNKFNGEYTLIVPLEAKATVVVSAEGYRGQTVELDPQQREINLDFRLEHVSSPGTLAASPTTEADETMPVKPVGNQYALLIGVSDYEDQSLNLANPVKDVGKLKDILTTHYGFGNDRVVTLANPTRSDLLGELFRLRSVISSNDDLLIFYAGHGTWDGAVKQGYWWPADAARDNPANWLSNSDLREQIRAINSAHTLLISDACFSGGIFRTRGVEDIRSAPLAMQMLYRTRSRTAMTSGNMSTVPDQSVFFDYVCRRLIENTEKYLPSQALFNSVRVAVINNSLAVPQQGVISDAGDEGGDFIFFRQ